MSRVEHREHACRLLAELVDIALAMGIEKLQLPSFKAGKITSAEGLANTAVCLCHACCCAAGTDLIIGTENALSAEQNLQLLDDVADTRLRVYFDTRNLVSDRGLDCAAMLEALYDHVCEVHIKDGMDNGPSALLGEGNSGFAESMGVLKRRSFAGWLLLENDYGTMTTACTPVALLRLSATAQAHLGG